MMDLKEIIKWFIPCFHVLLMFNMRKMDTRLTFVCLFLFFNPRPSFMAVISDSDINISNDLHVSKNFKLNNTEKVFRHNLSDYTNSVLEENEESRSLQDSSIGRTFGRPFKKMAQALIPLAFQIGSAATWAVVAAIVGIKTLAVSLIILKLLLVAGAAKFGALFASKGHQSHSWQSPHQKEIHLHIHNGQHGHHEEEIYPTWNRDGATTVTQDTKNYPYMSGPHTINTPFGSYVKVDPTATQ